jgi:hypothetical protein
LQLIDNYMAQEWVRVLGEPNTSIESLTVFFIDFGKANLEHDGDHLGSMAGEGVIESNASPAVAAVCYALGYVKTL